MALHPQARAAVAAYEAELPVFDPAFDIAASTISPSRIHHAIDIHNIPRNFFRPRVLKHTRAKLIVHQIIVSELARQLVLNFAFEQILDDFGLANIGYGNDLDVVIFQREVIEVPSDLSQAHNADTDLSVSHLATSGSKDRITGMALLYLSLNKPPDFSDGLSKFHSDDSPLGLSFS